MDRAPHSQAFRVRSHIEPHGPEPYGPETWVVMGVGAGLAPALALLPILQYVGWFFASLVHEIGHCIASWLFGAPAYPAIRIDGHAAAMHSEQSTVIAVLVYAGILALAWHWRARPALRWVMGAAVVLYPVLALTEAHELIHLLAGHLGELAFAGVFFFRALSGGFSESVAERYTYAMVAWFLLGKNIVLDIGLMTDAASRSAYAANGSFGLTQDFIRAGRVMGGSLEGVAALMLLFALATLPVAWWAWRRHERTAAMERPYGA